MGLGGYSILLVGLLERNPKAWEPGRYASLLPEYTAIHLSLFRSRNYTTAVLEITHQRQILKRQTVCHDCSHTGCLEYGIICNAKTERRAPQQPVFPFFIFIFYFLCCLMKGSFFQGSRVAESSHDLFYFVLVS